MALRPLGFPLELFDSLILDHFKPYHARANSRSLKNISLVSASTTDPCQKRLFSRVRIFQVDQAERLLEVLQRNNPLAHHIRDVIFCHDDDDERDYEEGVQVFNRPKAIERLVPFFANVHSLLLEGCSVPFKEELVSATASLLRLPCLTSLSLSSMEDFPVHLILEAQSLKCLQLIGLSESKNFPPTITATNSTNGLQHLTELKITHSTKTAYSFIAHLYEDATSHNEGEENSQQPILFPCLAKFSFSELEDHLDCRVWQAVNKFSSNSLSALVLGSEWILPVTPDLDTSKLLNLETLIIRHNMNYQGGEDLEDLSAFDVFETILDGLNDPSKPISKLKLISLHFSALECNGSGGRSEYFIPSTTTCLTQSPIWKKLNAFAIAKLDKTCRISVVISLGRPAHKTFKTSILRQVPFLTRKKMIHFNLRSG